MQNTATAALYCTASIYLTKPGNQKTSKKTDTIVKFCKNGSNNIYRSLDQLQMPSFCSCRGILPSTSAKKTIMAYIGNLLTFLVISIKPSFKKMVQLILVVRLLRLEGGQDLYSCLILDNTICVNSPSAFLRKENFKCANYQYMIFFLSFLTSMGLLQVCWRQCHLIPLKYGKYVFLG